MNLENDTNSQVDRTTDIATDDTDITGINTGTTDKGGNEDGKDDIRSLLEQAANLTVDEAGRVRDTTGKFAKVPEEGATDQGTDQGQQQAAATDNTGQQQQDWSKVVLPDELGAIVQALPEANRAAVHSALAQRETAWQQFAQQVNGHVNGYAELEKVIGPRREAWALQGAQPAQAVNQLLALSDFATRDPKGFISWFAGNNNIDLTEVGEEFVPPDPVIAQLNQRIEQLTGVVTNLTNGNANAAQQQLVDAVKTFETAQDDKGQPLRPHFSTVANEMLALVPHIRQSNPAFSHDQVLQQAYDQAVYANPTTRVKALAADEARRTAAAAAEMARKRNAGQSMTGLAPQDGQIQTNPIPSDSVRSALEAAIAIHS